MDMSAQRKSNHDDGERRVYERTSILGDLRFRGSILTRGHRG